MKGWIYIATNESFPDKLKIGFSDRHPSARMEELSNTSVPTPFVYVYGILCERADLVERKLHYVLDEYRFTKSREFFVCDAKYAIEKLEGLLDELEIEITFEEDFSEGHCLKCAPVDVRFALDEVLQEKKLVLVELKKRLRKESRINAIDKVVDLEIELINFKKSGFTKEIINKLCDDVNAEEFIERDELNYYLKDRITDKLLSFKWFFLNEPALNLREILEETLDKRTKIEDPDPISKHYLQLAKWYREQENRGKLISPIEEEKPQKRNRRQQLIFSASKERERKLSSLRCYFCKRPLLQGELCDCRRS